MYGSWRKDGCAGSPSPAARIDEEERLLALGDCEHDVDAGSPSLVTNHFSPFSTHSSPSRTAVAWRTVRSEPARAHERPRLAVVAVRDRRDVTVDLIRRRDLRTRARPAVGDCEAEAVRRLAGLLLERNLPDIDESRPPSRPACGIANPACRLRPQRGELVVVDGAALGDPLFERVDLDLDEATDSLLQRTDVLGQLGNDHRAAAPARRRSDGAPQRPRASPPRGERGDRQSPTSSTLSSSSPKCFGEVVHGELDLSEHEEICLDVLVGFAREDVPQLDGTVRRAHQLAVVEDAHPLGTAAGDRVSRYW